MERSNTLIGFLFFLLIPLCVSASEREVARPSIAEPMVFDLVRPLGAERGELEVNNLTRRIGQEWFWAPEIEYAFADGYSIEFELPFEGDRLAEYKAAVQGTIGTAFRGRLIHGWQWIAIRPAAAPHWSSDGLYLAGYQINRHWSAFTITGLRHSREGAQGHTLGLHNPSVFLTLSKHLTIGFENNFAWSSRDRNHRMHMPQMHIQLSRKNLIQFGFGWQKDGTGSAPVIGFRLVRQLKGAIED